MIQPFRIIDLVLAVAMAASIVFAAPTENRPEVTSRMTKDFVNPGLPKSSNLVANVTALEGPITACQILVRIFLLTSSFMVNGSGTWADWAIADKDETFLLLQRISDCGSVTEAHLDTQLSHRNQDQPSQYPSELAGVINFYLGAEACIKRALAEAEGDSDCENDAVLIAFQAEWSLRGKLWGAKKDYACEIIREQKARMALIVPKDTFAFADIPLCENWWAKLFHFWCWVGKNVRAEEDYARVIMREEKAPMALVVPKDSLALADTQSCENWSMNLYRFWCWRGKNVRADEDYARVIIREEKDRMALVVPKGNLEDCDLWWRKVFHWWCWHF